MKKMNNKGFLLVETIVVATFTLTVLVALFIQFKNLLVTYNNSYNYNKVENVYTLATIKNYIIQYQNSNNPLNKQLGNDSYLLLVQNGQCLNIMNFGSLELCNKLVQAGNIETLIFTDSDSTKIKDYIKKNDDDNITEEMRNIIKQLDKVKNQNRLVAEFIKKDSENHTIDATATSIVFGVNSK